jgi:hypothetical protein
MSIETNNEPSAADFKLIEEAIRRLRRSNPDAPRARKEVQDTLSREMRSGRRDLFGLTRLAQRALEMLRSVRH